MIYNAWKKKASCWPYTWNYKEEKALAITCLGTKKDHSEHADQWIAIKIRHLARYVFLVVIWWVLFLIHIISNGSYSRAMLFFTCHDQLLDNFFFLLGLIGYKNLNVFKILINDDIYAYLFCYLKKFNTFLKIYLYIFVSDNSI